MPETAILTGTATATNRYSRWQGWQYRQIRSYGEVGVDELGANEVRANQTSI